MNTKLLQKLMGGLMLASLILAACGPATTPTAEKITVVETETVLPTLSVPVRVGSEASGGGGRSPGLFPPWVW